MSDHETSGWAGASPADVAALVEQLSHVASCIDAQPAGPGERLELVEQLERLKSAAAAAQVRATASFVAEETARVESVRAEARRQGRTQPRSTLVVGSQVGLARRESPARGRRHADAAVTLVRDLPQTLAALTRGDLDEERAMVVVRESQDLCPRDRRQLDRELAEQSQPDPHDPTRRGGPFGSMGPEALRQAVLRLSLRLDEEAATRRVRRARRERRVCGRLLGDGTGRVTAVLPHELYSAVLGALGQAAAAARAAGDSRTADQVKADTLASRVTGLDTTKATPVAVNLVIGVESLLGHSDEPGLLLGLTTTSGHRFGSGASAGYVPAGLCADLVGAATDDARAALRRLFTAPGDDQLVAVESASRLFDRHLALMVNLRDGERCRTPWCDAPARHVDHVLRSADGGPTSVENGQALCEACNLVKETPGWTSWSSRAPDGGHQVGTLTPHGHLHLSHPPPLPGDRRHHPPAPTSVEYSFAVQVDLGRAC